MEGQSVSTGYQIQVVRTFGPHPWVFRILSPSGRVVLLSKGYATKPSAWRAAKTFDFFYREHPVRLEQGETERSNA